MRKRPFIGTGLLSVGKQMVDHMMLSSQAKKKKSYLKSSKTHLHCGFILIHWEKQQNRFMKGRSEEHTSELQSRGHLVCRLLLEKKNTNTENLVIQTEDH